MNESLPELNENSLVETEKLCEARFKILDGKKTIETFVGTISGQWIFNTGNGRGHVRVNEFVGDFINRDKGGWVAIGMSTVYISINGHTARVAWSLDYDPIEDSILWITGLGAQKFLNVSDTSSPIQWDLNQDSKKLVVIVRKTVPFVNYYLVQNSYIQISGF